MRAVLHTQSTRARGVTFIEVLMTSAVIVLVFGGLFTGVQKMIIILAHSKAQSGATALANETIEYVRSLPYNDVGTLGGIPNGNIEQTATITLNDLEYTRRVLIQYVDGEEDGLGGSDTNGITADYKRVKIELSWKVRGDQRSISLISNVVPPGIESVTGGGTLTVNVFNATVQPVSGATVRVYNDTTTSTIDVSADTNTNGVVMFPGAPEASNYQLSVTKAGYSSDQTYSASTTNPNPNPPHVSVVESLVSTINFAIDETSDLTIETVDPPTVGDFSDIFPSTINIETLSSTTVSGGDVVLIDDGGVYRPSGFVRATATEPALLDSWTSFDFSATGTADTTYAVQLFSVDGSGGYSLVPDGDLPGNSVGFVAGPVDIQDLDIGTYPRLALGGVLTSATGAETPAIEDWRIDYIISESPISAVTFNLRGTKTIGVGGGPELLRYNATHTTDGVGTITRNDLEWDQYDLTINGVAEGYNIAEACDPIPLTINPGTNYVSKLTLTPYVANSLRVLVTELDGTSIPNASVALSNVGINVNDNTSICGQVFFNSGLYADNSYQVAVSASGFDSEVVSSVEVGDQTSLTVTLTES